MHGHAGQDAQGASCFKLSMVDIPMTIYVCNRLYLAKSSQKLGICILCIYIYDMCVCVSVSVCACVCV